MASCSQHAPPVVWNVQLLHEPPASASWVLHRSQHSAAVLALSCSPRELKPSTMSSTVAHPVAGSASARDAARSRVASMEEVVAMGWVRDDFGGGLVWRGELTKAPGQPAAQTRPGDTETQRRPDILTSSGRRDPGDMIKFLKNVCCSCI
jgi:hypothetical protein